MKLGVNVRARAWTGAGFNPAQPQLLPQRVGTMHPLQPNGADIAFVCTTREGGVFYCKDDKPGRPIRAVEMIATRLAGHLNIAVPYCAIVEDNEGRTFFGSLSNESPSEGFEVRAYLTKPSNNELGMLDPWLGRSLAALYAYDLFLGNPDRSVQNFLLEKGSRRLCAFDFADVRLEKLSDDRISIGDSHTLRFGRFVRSIHGPHVQSALEMVDRIGVVPADRIESILNELPDDWLPTDQREGLCDVWNNQRLSRLAALRAGLKDGSLL